MEILARASLPKREGNMDAEIVLRYFDHNTCTPYVTHQHNIQYGEKDGYYWGHYFKTLEEAQVDFVERCKERGAL